MLNHRVLPVLLGYLVASNAATLTAGSELGSHRLVARASNDTLPIYKDALYCIEDRVEDLIQRMTLPEKAGLFWHGRLIPGPNGTLDAGNSERNSTEFMVGTQLISHFNLVGTVESARRSAEFHNRVQQYIIDNTRLGIPLSLSTDPRHAFTDNTGTGALAGKFSEWPETTGLAALRSADLVRTFATIAREEYLAIGIRASLHPQVDLWTEPRWARGAATFGEDANLTAELLVEYIKAFQGDKIGPHSVSTVTKHFPGGGPMEGGEDSHFTW
jgi:beta-glucosidase